MDKQISYTTINHLARKKLGLSMHEYTLADLIYNLANNPRSEYPGWCYASKIFMADTLDLSEQSIHQLLNRLINKRVLQKHPDTKHLKVTFDWYSRVVIVDTKQSLARLKKVESSTKESLVGGTKQSLVNKDIYNKGNNNIYKPSNKFTSLKDIGEKEILEIAENYRVPVSFVRVQLESLKNYCEAKGRRYKNYKAALRNFVLSSRKDWNGDNRISKPTPPEEKDYTISSEERAKARKRMGEFRTKLGKQLEIPK